MKRILSLCTLLISGFLTASAQTYPLFNTSESIDIGNIKAAHLVHGDMWWDPATATARCEYPKGSGKHVGFAADIWLAGYDDQNVLKVAGQDYRQNGTDYWPGPLDTSAMSAGARYAQAQSWAKIWKINWRQIDSFKKITNHTQANTPVPLLEWPAIGNPYAKGAGGISLAITTPQAPFVDVNGDGRYNPLNGDYPLIKGDQFLWWVINDNGPAIHGVSNSSPLYVEIKVSAFAYARGTTVDNAIFYEYLIKNGGKLNLHNFRAGIYADMDLGYPFDDYAGFDSTRRLALTYNGKNIDGSGAPGDYGENPPAAGVTILELPGDRYNAYSPVGSFILNDISHNGTEMYRLMNSMFHDGRALPNGRRYQFDLDTLSQYNECFNSDVSGDRRFVVASSDFSLNAGDSKKFAVSLIVAAASGGCPYFNPAPLQSTADTTYKYYWNPPAPQTTAVASLAAQPLRIYPDPAKSTLFIEMATPPTGTLQIFDAIGRMCPLSQSRHGNRIELNTGNLSPGIYSIRYQDATSANTAIFVKE